MLGKLQEILLKGFITIKSKTSTIFRKEKIVLETTSRQCHVVVVKKKPQQFR